MNNKGFAPIAILIIIVAVLGIGGLYYYVTRLQNQVFDSNEEIDLLNTNPSAEVQYEQFEQLNETENTPEVISNEALDTLDAIVNEVETTSVDEADLDLNL